MAKRSWLEANDSPQAEVGMAIGPVAPTTVGFQSTSSSTPYLGSSSLSGIPFSNSVGTSGTEPPSRL